MKKIIFILTIVFTINSFSKNDNPHVIKMPAVYEVPTTSEELASIGKFSFTAKIKKLQSGNTQISYDLPIELTGVEQDIKITNTVNNPQIFTGFRANVRCASLGSEQACTLEYNQTNLLGGSADAINFLSTQNLSPEDLTKKSRLATLFGCDPIGVLQFDLSGKPLDPNSPLMIQERTKALEKINASCAQ
jgi:hypothetical protein